MWACRVKGVDVPVGGGCVRGRGAWMGRAPVSWTIRRPDYPMDVIGHHRRPAANRMG